MCVTIASTAHPEYPLILINNRDEFLNRRTLPAHWWDSPHQHVLGGRDLQRQERGTWLGITKQGRLANLTNFREDEYKIVKDKSRGGIINAYLTLPSEGEDDQHAFAKYLVDEVGVHDVGGFSLLYGQLKKPIDGAMPGLAIVSNRTESAEGLQKVATGADETFGLSNSHYGDRSWPKVVHGEELLKQAIQSNNEAGGSIDRFVDSLFDVLSVDTLPRPQPGEDFQMYTKQLRKSILIPPVGGEGVEDKPADKIAAARSAGGTDTPDHSSVQVGHGAYGTHQQTVLLVRKDGMVTFVEKTLHESGGDRIERYEFEIEGWDE